MGRLKEKPNKKCINCVNWQGPLERVKGLVIINICKLTGYRVPHHFKCERYTYGGNSGEFAGYSED